MKISDYMSKVTARAPKTIRKREMYRAARRNWAKQRYRDAKKTWKQ